MKYEELIVKKDDRGFLVEAFQLPNDGQIFYVTQRPNKVRGNHYHKHKTERFLVITGTALLQVRDRDGGGVVKVELGGNNPLIVSVPPDHTHSITTGSEGCMYIVWVDEWFNPEDADTFAEEV